MAEIELKINKRDLDTLISTIVSNDPDADIDIIMRAYEKAQRAHKDQYRLSGEPFIIHPLEVALILANLNLDTNTIAAALLHDVVEDTGITKSDLKNEFNEEVALLVDGVTKISSLKKKSKHIEQAQNLRKMLMATIKDVRVILIKLADKLHNMRTIMFHPESKKQRIAREVLDIYAPLAGRLGISKIRSELEDLAFHVLNHEEYHNIKEKVAQRKQEIELYINNIRSILEKKFLELDITAQITGRAKHYYSIFRKMNYQGKSFNDIFDIRAIRIITDEIKDCYGILGVIHTLWSPITARFKDYIAVPKSNLYQSLHTTVMGPDGHPLEIQIRTREMHVIGEMGIAAHWIYKENPSHIGKDYRNLPLLKNIDAWDYEARDTKEFMKELKMDLYEDEIFVFTPKGKIIKLAKGSTPVDFAYAIHTEVGNSCTGAKVNNNIVPLKTELKSGDIVNILTSKKGHPSKAWLKFVRSSNARYKIRNWFRKNLELQKKGEPEQAPKLEKTAEVTIPESELIKIKKFSKKNKIALSIDGTSNVMIKLSQCCQPIPGDDVVGFITRGRGITIHRTNCPSLKRLKLEPERLINIVWESSESTYPIKLVIHAIDRRNLLKDLAEEIALGKTNIIKVEAQVIEEDTAMFKFIMEVKGVDHLNEIISRIKNVKNVTDVYKLNEKVIIK
jgi:guanosine-3',5'-bis(diphosphate) 3'-pyrophosphohydrolase